MWVAVADSGLFVYFFAFVYLLHLVLKYLSSHPSSPAEETEKIGVDIPDISKKKKEVGEKSWELKHYFGHPYASEKSLKTEHLKK